VADILGRDQAVNPRRPARVRTALFLADPGAGIHGWCARAESHIGLMQDGECLH
jgi:hypothetical protein